MELIRYKVCPECGTHNSPNRLECKSCEADLTGVKVVDSVTEAKQTSGEGDSSVPVNAPAQTLLVRICDCGAENPPQARKCKSCGEDISDIIPSQIDKNVQKQFAYELRTVDGGNVFVIDKPVIIIGREAEFKEYLAEKVYVSRRHARFTVVANKVFVENISATNKTFINNKEIVDCAPTAISDGDEIGIGGKVINGCRQDKAAYFIFQVQK